MSKPSVSIIIPTFQRPGDLLHAARSVFSQSLIDKTECTLIIVDNDPAGSAAQSIETLRAEAPEALTFVAAHEPRAGVSNARNCAIELVKTDLIAFLDDDQSAVDENWLEKLYQLHLEIQPTVTFGPLVTVLPETVRKHRAYFVKFFGRMDSSPRGFIKDFHGGCNTLIDMSQLPAKRPLFDESFNDSGGEDDALFAMIEEHGGTFAWEPDAAVYERVPVRRAHLGYTFRRAMVYGQGPINTARQKKQYHILLAWVAIGGLKMVWHGLRAGIGYIFRTNNRVEQFDLALRGLSKVVFWRQRKMYGQSALRSDNVVGQDKVTIAPGQ